MSDDFIGVETEICIVFVVVACHERTVREGQLDCSDVEEERSTETGTNRWESASCSRVSPTTCYCSLGNNSFSYLVLRAAVQWVCNR